MTTQQRFRRDKYRLQVRERDHNPPHVHLVGGGLDIIIDLATLRSEGCWPKDLRVEVLAWVAAHRDELWEEWHKWHAS